MEISAADSSRYGRTQWSVTVAGKKKESSGAKRCGQCGTCKVIRNRGLLCEKDYRISRAAREFLCTGAAYGDKRYRQHKVQRFQKQYYGGYFKNPQVLTRYGLKIFFVVASLHRFICHKGYSAAQATFRSRILHARKSGKGGAAYIGGDFCFTTLYN